MVKEVYTYKEFLNYLKKHNISENPYLSFEYYDIFCDTFLQYEKKFKAFIIFNDEGSVKGILPVVRRTLSYIILGYRYSNYLGYICKDEDVEYVDSEIKKYISLKYPNMIILYYDINNSTQLFGLLSKEKFAHKIFLYNCPFCSVDTSFDNVLKRQISKSKKRAELKKFEKKLNVLGQVEILNIDDNLSWEKNKNFFPYIYGVHRKRFENVYIPKDLCLYKNEEYYSKLFESLVKSKKGYVSILLLDKKVISFVYCVVSGSIIMDWMPAFDPVFAKYNLGTIHLMKIFEYVCLNNRYKVFDFSKGDGLYKDRWSNGFTQNYMFVRRFTSAPGCILLQSSIVMFYSFKSWLREKGILNKIKLIIRNINAASGCKNNIKKEPIKLLRLEKAEADINWTEYSYAEVVKYNDDIQQILLNEYYSKPYTFFCVNNNQVFVC